MCMFELQFDGYNHSRNKRIFRGPGVVGGQDLRRQAKTCARKLASVASRGSLVASRQILNLLVITF